MPPKEKAEQLLNKYDLTTGLMSSERKECALICVNEIIEEGYNNDMYQSRINYWQKVKQEINNL